MRELIPHIQQYTGIWSIEPAAESRFKQIVNGMDWALHFKEAQSRIDAGEHKSHGGYELTADGVAVVDLEGVLTKYGSSLSMGGSTVNFRSTLRNIKRAHEVGQVKAVMLCIESPGGSTMGTPEAAAEVAALAAVMPVWCYFEDIGASAAYWIGSQATRVIANASAMVGSIGTYFAVDDLSGAFNKAGIKTHLFTTGAHKGAGYAGTELSEAQIAEFQSLVDRMNAPFVAAVAKARNLSGDALSTVTTGQVWRGDEAVAVGLIDAVMTYDDALAELAGRSQTPNGASQMSNAKPKASATAPATAPKSEEVEKEPKAEEVEGEEEEKPAEIEKKSEVKPAPGEQAASIAQLRAALPKASSDFLLSALEGGMSVATARMTWMEQTVASQAAEIEALKAAGPKPGAKPLGTTGTAKTFDGTDPKAAWEAAIKAKTDAGMTRAKAISAVVREQPELQQAFIDASNAK